MDTNSCYAKLKPCSLGFALGVVKGFYLMLLALVAMHCSACLVMVNHIAGFYHGYAATYVGSLYGLGLGFLCGFVFGMLIGYLYNFCLCCSACKTSCKK